MGKGLGELLDDIRAVYCRALAAELIESTSQGRAEVTNEVALRDADGRAAMDGSLRLPMRIDLVTIEDGVAVASASVTSETMISFAPISFAWGTSLDVELAPFQWDGLVFRFRGRRSTDDWAPLVRWFRKWFREDEDGDGTSLLGAVHFLSEPRVDGGWTAFETDLGSAPVEAFEELLDAIAALGVAEVRIGAALDDPSSASR
jgi:hypothetical protein